MKPYIDEPRPGCFRVCLGPGSYVFPSVSGDRAELEQFLLDLKK